MCAKNLIQSLAGTTKIVVENVCVDTRSNAIVIKAQPPSGSSAGADSANERQSISCRARCAPLEMQ